ncbi:MAG: histidinol-phosphatase [Sphingomonadales bacterium]
MTTHGAPWTEYLEFTDRLADAAAEITVSCFRTPLTVADKTDPDDEDFDPVTEADRRTEAVLRAIIEAHYPDHGILGEEQARKQGKSPFFWVIDPIDGTRSYISGIPLWGTLIALNNGIRPIVGMMDQPILGERFTGTPDGAFRNGEPVSTRPCPDLSKAILFTTDPDMFEESGELKAFREVERQVKLRRFGGDCYAYCLLARGLVDLVIEGDLKPYDIQALIPIVEGAGGIVTTWDGGPADNGGLVVAAGDKRLHAQALEILGNR